MSKNKTLKELQEQALRLLNKYKATKDKATKIELIKLYNKIKEYSK